MAELVYAMLVGENSEVERERYKMDCYLGCFANRWIGMRAWFAANLSLARASSAPFNIAMGARFLAGSAHYLPKDAVFVAVIDAGVGSAREAMLAKSRVGQFFVLPDNGLLTLVRDRDCIVEAREIVNPAWTAAQARTTVLDWMARSTAS